MINKIAEIKANWLLKFDFGFYTKPGLSVDNEELLAINLLSPPLCIVAPYFSLNREFTRGRPR